MYAVIRSGGKQYRVSKGERLRLDTIKAEPGSTLEIDQVLAVHDGKEIQIGKPLVESAKVTAKVVGHGRGRKITVFRFKRRKGFHKKQGHRQGYTEVQIEDIKA